MNTLCLFHPVKPDKTPLVAPLQIIARIQVCLFLLSATLCAQANYVNFEGKQTSPIRLSPDGTRLFAVNTPDARLSVFDVTQPSNPRLIADGDFSDEPRIGCLSVFDVTQPSNPRLIAEIPVGVEPVSVNPRNNDEAWVVNEVSDSISVVSVSNRMVMDTICVKDEPVEVVFAGNKAFVSASRKNWIAV